MENNQKFNVYTRTEKMGYMGSSAYLKSVICCKEGWFTSVPDSVDDISDIV